MKATIKDINDLRPITLALWKARYRGELDALDSVLIRAQDTTGLIEFVATDLDHTKIFRVPGDIEEPGAVLVDLKEFKKIINKLRKFDGALTIEDEEDNESWASFTHDALDFRMSGAHPEDFADVDYSPIGDAQRFDAADFRDALGSAAQAMSSDDARRNLCGVYLDGDALASTDGHRLRKVVLEGAEFDGTIIPDCAVSALEYALGKFSADEIAVYEDDDLTVFDFGDHTITCRPIAGSFPDYTATFPDFSDATTIRTDRKDAIKSLEAVRIFASPQTDLVRLSTDRSGIAELYASSPGSGEGKTTLEGDVDGPPVKSGFRAEYLKDAFKDFDTDEIEISVIDTLSPTRIRRADDDSGDMWIVMPMRL